MVLECLVPGLAAMAEGVKLPGHVLSVEAADIRHVKLIDATPIGVNVRPTVATYANVVFRTLVDNGQRLWLLNMTLM